MRLHCAIPRGAVSLDTLLCMCNLHGGAKFSSSVSGSSVSCLLSASSHFCDTCPVFSFVQIKENNAKLKHWQKELGKLKLEQTGLEESTKLEDLKVRWSAWLVSLLLVFTSCLICWVKSCAIRKIACPSHFLSSFACWHLIRGVEIAHLALA